MKNKKQVYIVLGIILGVLLCSSIYVNLIAKTTTGLMAVIIAQMIIGIGAAIFTLFTGLKLFEDKKIRTQPVCKGIEKRLNEIKSRISYAGIVYNKLQSEKE